MKTIIKCPKCLQPTIHHDLIYPPEEVVQQPFENYISEKSEYYKKYGDGIIFISSDASPYSFRKVSQIVFKCSTCGFTRVVDL